MRDCGSDNRRAIDQQADVAVGDQHVHGAEREAVKNFLSHLDAPDLLFAVSILVNPGPSDGLGESLGGAFWPGFIYSVDSWP